MAKPCTDKKGRTKEKIKGGVKKVKGQHSIENLIKALVLVDGHTRDIQGTHGGANTAAKEDCQNTRGEGEDARGQSSNV